MKKYIEFINEIASIITPDIIVSKPNVMSSYFEFKIENDVYYLNINLYDILKSYNFIDKSKISNAKDLTTIRIDFDLKAEDRNNSKLTNKNIALRVLGNIVGVIKYWIELNLAENIENGDKIFLKDVIINYICLESKCEKEDDNRRSEIYDYYFEKFINAKVINKQQPKFIGINTDYISIMNVYKIEPTNIKNIIK